MNLNTGLHHVALTDLVYAGFNTHALKLHMITMACEALQASVHVSVHATTRTLANTREFFKSPVPLPGLPDAATRPLREWPGP
jgi:hypothetical protein